MDNHGLTRAHLPFAINHLPCRQCAKRHRCSIDERKNIADAEHIHIGHDGVTSISTLRVLPEDAIVPAEVVTTGGTCATYATGETRLHHHAITDGNAAYARADRFNFTRDIAAEA